MAGGVAKAPRGWLPSLEGPKFWPGGLGVWMSWRVLGSKVGLLMVARVSRGCQSSLGLSCPFPLTLPPFPPPSPLTPLHRACHSKKYIWPVGYKATSPSTYPPLPSPSLPNPLPPSYAPRQLLSLGRIEWLNRTFHSEKYIWPVGYKARRLAKTPAAGGEGEVWHTLEVLEQDGQPLFRCVLEYTFYNINNIISFRMDDFSVWMVMRV